MVGAAWCKAGPLRAAARLASAILCGGLLAAVIAILQATKLTQAGIWIVDAVSASRPGANLAQPNNLATLLGISCASLLLLFEQRRLSGRAACLAAGVLLAAMAATQSRTALIFGPIVLAGVTLARRRAVEIRISNRVLVLTICAYFAMVWLWPKVQSSLQFGELDSIVSRGLGSVRFEMWSVLWDAMSQQPWSGYGWLQVGAAELAAVDRHPAPEEMWQHGHNLFVDLIVWCGYPIGILLSSAVIFWVVTRTLRVRTVEAVVGMLVVAIIGAHAMLELPHHYLYFLVPAGLWIGQIESSLRSTSRVSSMARVAKWLPVTLCLALAAMILRDYWKVEDEFRLFRFEAMNFGPARADGPTPNAPAMSTLTTFLRLNRTSQLSNMSPSELGELIAITRRYPYAPSLSRCALALALNGRTDEAVEFFWAIRQMYGRAVFSRQRDHLRERIAAGEHALASLESALPQE